MDRFWDLLQESVVVSGLVALVLVGTCCYLWVKGQPVPELLEAALMMVLGFFFGVKVEKTRRTTRASG